MRHAQIFFPTGPIQLKENVSKTRRVAQHCMSRRFAPGQRSLRFWQPIYLLPSKARHPLLPEGPAKRRKLGFEGTGTRRRLLGLFCHQLGTPRPPQVSESLHWQRFIFHPESVQRCR